MKWNYRIVELSSGGYEIRTAYYNAMGDVKAVADRGFTPFGEDLKELRQEFKQYKKAMELPPLKEKDYEDLQA